MVGPSAAADIDQFGEMIRAARSAVVFTGAGISTDSGIPDFRSPGGLWSQFKPIDFDEFMSSEAIRKKAWERKFDLDEAIGSPEPNGGHRAVANLLKQGKVSHVITQNIDGLHQAAGVPAEKVIELHGNNTFARCLTCQKRYELEPIKQQFLVDQQPPYCDECGGVIKSAVISFGQSMPVVAMAQAEQATRQADLFIAIGSSLQVYPAAGFPRLAAELNIPLVILNREPTDLDDTADLVLNTEITPVLIEVTRTQ